MRISISSYCAGMVWVNRLWICLPLNVSHWGQIVSILLFWIIDLNNHWDLISIHAVLIVRHKFTHTLQSFDNRLHWKKFLLNDSKNPDKIFELNRRQLSAIFVMWIKSLETLRKNITLGIVSKCFDIYLLISLYFLH